MNCLSPLALDDLLAYWLGELDPDAQARTEEHYLGCAQCSQRLEELTSLMQGVRELARTGGVNMILNEAFVRRLKKDGLAVREYHLPHNGSVNCTVAPGDDVVVASLEVPLAGVQRMDMVTVDSGSGHSNRQEDIPFTAASGNVVFAMPTGTLRALPQTRIHVHLLAVDAGHDRPLGEYIFNHTPYRT